MIIPIIDSSLKDFLTDILFLLSREYYVALIKDSESFKDFKEQVEAKYSKNDIDTRICELDSGLALFNRIKKIAKSDLIPLFEKLYNEVSAENFLTTGIINDQLVQNFKKNSLDNDDFDNLKALGEYIYSENLQKNNSIRKVYFSEIDIYEEFRMSCKGLACPYCGIEILELISCDPDHYLPKQKYPMLSIFPENLIGSCMTCNQRVKGSKIFLPIIHPRHYSFLDNVNFKFQNINGSATSFDSLELLDTNNRGALRNFIKLFQLNQRINDLHGKTIELIESNLKEFKGSSNKEALKEYCRQRLEKSGEWHKKIGYDYISSDLFDSILSHYPY